MLGKVSMIGAIAVTLMIVPTTLSDQAPNVGPSVRGGVERGIPGPLPPPGARGVVVERGGPIVGRRYHGGLVRHRTALLARSAPSIQQQMI